jgi:hypothetical protein
MDEAQSRAMRKVRKCMALANDERGDPTTRETALRQAAALMAKLDYELGASPTPAAPVVPLQSSPEWAPYWARRTTTEAMRAGVRTTVLCRDGHFVPG